LPLAQPNSCILDKYKNDGTTRLPLPLISTSSLPSSIIMADSIPAQATQGKGDFVQQLMDDKRWVEEPELMPWYVKELTELEPATRKLFETYSNVPSDEVVSHIKKVRDKAFRVVSLPAQRMLETGCRLLHWPTSYVPQFPYPCLGHWGFLNLSIGTSNAYQEILDRVKNGEQYLDLGCCVGQDIRKLVSDGAPSENTYGSDLKASFWDIVTNRLSRPPSSRPTFSTPTPICTSLMVRLTLSTQHLSSICLIGTAKQLQPRPLSSY
jgi:hypothetical protein